MSRHGDFELTRLNYVLFPDESIGPHTRVDIANGAIEEIKLLRASRVDQRHLIETLATALGVDLGSHGLTELVHAAAERIGELKGSLRCAELLNETHVERMKPVHAQLKVLVAASGVKPCP